MPSKTVRSKKNHYAGPARVVATPHAHRTSREQPVPASDQVVDRMESAVDLAATQWGKYHFLAGSINQNVKWQMQKMIDANQGMTHADALAKVAEWYGRVLNKQQCANVRAILNLSAVLTAKYNLVILQGLMDSEYEYRLSKGEIEALWKMATSGAARDVINEVALKVQDEKNRSTESRIAAIQEFARGNWEGALRPNQVQFTGSAAEINIGGGFQPFNPYALARLEQFSQYEELWERTAQMSPAVSNRYLAVQEGLEPREEGRVHPTLFPPKIVDIDI